MIHDGVALLVGILTHCYECDGPDGGNDDVPEPRPRFASRIDDSLFHSNPLIYGCWFYYKNIWSAFGTIPLNEVPGEMDPGTSI